MALATRHALSARTQRGMRSGVISSKGMDVLFGCRTLVSGNGNELEKAGERDPRSLVTARIDRVPTRRLQVDGAAEAIGPQLPENLVGDRILVEDRW